MPYFYKASDFVVNESYVSLWQHPCQDGFVLELSRFWICLFLYLYLLKSFNTKRVFYCDGIFHKTEPRKIPLVYGFGKVNNFLQFFGFVTLLLLSGSALTTQKEKTQMNWIWN